MIIALGSNLPGDYDSSRALLKAALDELEAAGLHIIRVSRLWRSVAWPDPADPAYLNAVAMVETALEPAAVLTRLHGIEAAFGRSREAANAPRTLDLDLIAFGRTVSEHPALPHPRAHQRLFVIGPLAEIAPAWRHPVTGESAEDLAKNAGVGTDAHPIQSTAHSREGEIS